MFIVKYFSLIYTISELKIKSGSFSANLGGTCNDRGHTAFDLVVYKKEPES
jgi:hypothetical protein